jgi:hypothetical protein
LLGFTGPFGFFEPRNANTADLSAAKKAWLNAYGMSMRLKGEIIGKLAEIICRVFSAVYEENGRGGACNVGRGWIGGDSARRLLGLRI